MHPARLAARTARRRDRNRAHRHVVLLAPEPYGALELPVVYSEGAYEALIAHVSRQTGAGILGGPLLAWCRCDARDPRRAGAASPYWAVAVPGADAIRAAVEAEVAALVARLEGVPRERWLDTLFPRDDRRG